MSVGCAWAAVPLLSSARRVLPWLCRDVGQAGHRGFASSSVSVPGPCSQPHSLLSPRSQPTAAEGTQRGARGHKGEMAEPEPIHPAVSQSWEGRLLGFWLANSNANYFFPEGGFDVAEAWSPCAGQGAAQASQRWWASPCNGACCRNAIITECQAVIQLG